MATVQVAIIDRAYRLLHQVGEGVSANTAKSAAALQALNAMLDTWRLDRLMCVAVRDESIALVGADPSYTVGPAGDLNTTRPVKLEGAYVVVGAQSYRVAVIDEGQYSRIEQKALQGPYPEMVWYQATTPLGVLYPWPVPLGGPTLHILTRTPLAAVALVDVFAFPPGWEDAMCSHLAVRLSPECETTPAETVYTLARDSMAAIKRTNMVPLHVESELTGLVTRGRVYNVISDTP